GGSAAQAAVEISLSVFQQDLAPYGRWGDDPSYGQVWYPAVAPGWRPYYDNGHWEYSDEYGWLWVSDLPWGWAPFHYGRWVMTAYGWAWVPGTEWGPAWVTFRSAPDYIGWAPLPPDDYWDDSYGFRRHVDVVDVRCWNFVRPEGFVAHRFDRYAYDRRDYPRFIHNTTNITNITIINNRVVNRGIQVDHVERLAHRRVERVSVADANRPTRTEVQGNRVTLFRPRVTNTGNQQLQHQNLQNNGAQEFSNQQQLNKRRNSNGQQQFVPPQQTQPTFGTNEQPQTLKKRRNQQQQFVPPEQQTQPTFGTNEQQQTLKKKRNQQQQFFQPPEEQTQPSAGGNQQPYVLKKHRNNGQQEFAAPSNGAQGQQQLKRRQNNNASFGQQQFQQQPKIRQQQVQPQVQFKQQQQPQQNNAKRYKNQRQCQQGDNSCN
ncbi:MAG TPA: DUF6600 domain-containing protein, partial [Candidatus Acidoferrum sp.]|nr:DUF6600 domain-containing protein [Candidatus Acidoferrum sp.]